MTLREFHFFQDKIPLMLILSCCERPLAKQESMISNIHDRALFRTGNFTCFNWHILSLALLLYSKNSSLHTPHLQHGIPIPKDYHKFSHRHALFKVFFFYVYDGILWSYKEFSGTKATWRHDMTWPKTNPAMSNPRLPEEHQWPLSPCQGIKKGSAPGFKGYTQIEED